MLREVLWRVNRVRNARVIVASNKKYERKRQRVSQVCYMSLIYRQGICQNKKHYDWCFLLKMSVRMSKANCGYASARTRRRTKAGKQDT